VQPSATPAPVATPSTQPAAQIVVPKR